MDVVFERLKEVTEKPCMLRARQAKDRKEASQTITRLLSNASKSRPILDNQISILEIEGRTAISNRWQQIRRNASARTAANELAEQLLKISENEKSISTSFALQKVPQALSAIPVWGITSLSARTYLPLKPKLFDLVVIDEASACDIASTLPLLVRAKRALIIGDSQQLTHVTKLSPVREHTIGKNYGLTEKQAENFSYNETSCFELACARLNEPPIFLDKHFRSHLAIIEFSNKRFYDNRLELCSDSKPPGDLPAIEWRHVDGDSETHPSGQSRINNKEARVLVNALASDAQTLHNLGLSLGVVTPYEAQARLIKHLLDRKLSRGYNLNLIVGTAHRFQGDERDVIYFSPVVGPSMTDLQIKFAANPNLVNVALTRARRRLVIFGNMRACLARRNVLADLARYVNSLKVGDISAPT